MASFGCVHILALGDAIGLLALCTLLLVGMRVLDAGSGW